MSSHVDVSRSLILQEEIQKRGKFGRCRRFLEYNRNEPRSIFEWKNLFILIELLTASGKCWNFFLFLKFEIWCTAPILQRDGNRGSVDVSRLLRAASWKTENRAGDTPQQQRRSRQSSRLSFTEKRQLFSQHFKLFIDYERQALPLLFSVKSFDILRMLQSTSIHFSEKNRITKKKNSISFFLSR